MHQILAKKKLYKCSPTIKMSSNGLGGTHSCHVKYERIQIHVYKMVVKLLNNELVINRY